MSAYERHRHELEHQWKARTEDAKARLDLAAGYLEELSENPKSIAQTDAETHTNAIRAYTEVLQEYIDISRIYQDLVLHGTVPEEVLQLHPMKLPSRGTATKAS